VSAQRLARHVAAVISAAGTAPDDRLSLLEMSAPDEVAALSAGNGTARPFPAERGVADLVAARAAERPEAVALVHREAQVSYRELVESSTAVAHHVVALGVRPGDVVGLYTDRGVDMVVGMLAAATAGAAYLPIDRAAPAERIGAILADAAAAVVLTQRSIAEALPDTVRRLPLDALEPVPAVALPDVHGDDVCYVRYTSGSTGTPKGVMVPHRPSTARV
jgi:non-ribosomal peptide synthetase component F